MKNKDREEVFSEELDYRLTLNMQLQRIGACFHDLSKRIQAIEHLEDMLSPYLDNEAKNEIDNIAKMVRDYEVDMRGTSVRTLFYDGEEGVREMMALFDYVSRKKYRVLIALMDRKGLLLTGRVKLEGV